MGFPETIAAVVADLEAAGIDASSDARKVNPPGALVVPDAVVPFVKLNRTDQLRMVILLLARDAGDDDATAALGDLYAAVMASAALARSLGQADVTFERRVLPDSPAGMPALRITITRPIAPDQE